MCACLWAVLSDFLMAVALRLALTFVWFDLAFFIVRLTRLS
jgi:hypothetical protein